MAVACAWPAAVAAGGEAPRVAFSAGPSILHFDHREYADGGARLVRESGALPGLAAGIVATSGPWRLALDAAWHAGAVDYRGQTQAGAPLATVTDTRIAETGLRAMRFVDDDRRYGLGLGIGYRRWYRDIRGVGSVAGLDERYSNWLASLDATAVLARSPQWSVGVDLRLTRTLGSEVAVSFGGRFDDQRLGLGEQWGWRLAVPALLRTGRSSGIRIEPWYEYWGFDRSDTEPLLRDGRPVGTVYQPDGKGRNYGLRVLWAQGF